MKEQRLKLLTTLKKLYLGTAILYTICAIPLVGYIINGVFALSSIIGFALAVAIFSFARKARMSIIPAILSFMASGLGTISMIIILLLPAQQPTTVDVLMETNPVFTEALIIGVIAWLLYVIATVYLYIGFVSTRKMLRLEGA